jgi:hypothetical protein
LVNGGAKLVCTAGFACEFIQSKAVDMMNRIYRMGSFPVLICSHPHLVHPVCSVSPRQALLDRVMSAFLLGLDVVVRVAGKSGVAVG